MSMGNSPFMLPHQFAGTKTYLSDKWMLCPDPDVCVWNKGFPDVVLRHWHAVQFTQIASPVPREQGEYPPEPITHSWWLVLFEDVLGQYRLTSMPIPA
jgi:hypothetical protein